MCHLVASWSEDQSRKIGSVIVGPANEIRSTGYNGLPRKVNAHLEERHSRPDKKKYLWFEHAERNAIFNLTRSGTGAAGCRMYITHFPCADCARAIIQTGIIEVRTFPFDPDDINFSEHYAVAESMFQESGVVVSLYLHNDPLLKEMFCNLTALVDEQIR